SLLVNSGTLTATNGTLSLSLAPVQNGAVNVATSGKLDVAQAWSNDGSLIMSGGFLVNGAVTNLAGRNLTGFGTISNLVVNLGTLTATNGTLTLSLAPVQNGAFNIVANSGTLAVNEAWQNNGTLLMQGGNLLGGTITNVGTLTGSGFIKTFVVNQ